jgi:DNA-binding winged helix-turn-helix (wHTH) protein/tetratricopeptide (TPR) repeat protein
MDRSLSQSDSGFTFGSLRLEPDGTLFRGDEAIHLAPKELAALRVLLKHRGHIVTPAQLKETLWPDVHVTADSVPRCVSSLRSRLGAEALIRTIYKRGYRFESPVHRVDLMELGALPRLAIMPFAGGINVPEFLGAAIAEDAGTHLLTFHPATVRVLPRDSVWALAAAGISARELGQKLAADLVLTGVVQASILLLRVRAEMIRAADGSQVWVEEVMGPREHCAAIEQRLFERISCRLGGQLPVSISASASETRDQSSSTHEALLLARHDGRSRDPLRMSSAVDLLLKACGVPGWDPTAREQIVKITLSQCLYGYISPAVAAEQVRRASDAHPQLDQSSAALLPVLGWILFHVEHNLGFALHMIQDTDVAGPGTWPTTLRVMLALSRHRFGEARALLEETLRDDSWSPTFNVLLAWTHHLSGTSAESLDLAQRCLDLFPHDERAELCAALILAFNSHPERAASLAHAVARRLPSLDVAAAIEAYALARFGKTDEAGALLERLQWTGHERYMQSSFTAAAFAAMGDEDAAIAELRTAEKARCPWFFQTLADPRLNSLHHHPEFKRMQAILQTMEASVIPESECVV